MKAHVEPKSKECPFCGAPTYEIVSVTGMKCVRCTNKRTCGASSVSTTKTATSAVYPRLSISIGGQERGEADAFA